MVCANCGKQIAENSNFCYFCGSRQYGGAGGGAGSRPAGGGVGTRRLYRSTTNKSMGGVLGGFAEYLDIDPSLLRVIYVLVTFFTGIIPGVLAYFVAWMVMSEAPASEPQPNAWAAARGSKRLMRSVTNRKWAGVCGGLGEYLDVDPTVIRIIWVVLSIVPGAVVLGFVVYLLAWMVMPEAPRQLSASAEGAGQPVPHSS